MPKMLIICYFFSDHSKSMKYESKRKKDNSLLLDGWIRIFRWSLFLEYDLNSLAAFNAPVVIYCDIETELATVEVCARTREKAKTERM